MPRVPEGAPSEAPAGAAEVRFELTGIILEGVTAYKESDLAPLWQDLLAKEVSLADIYDVAAEITAKYRNDGYILSRAIVPPQDIQAGVVRIQVIEGYVDKVTIEGDPGGPIEQITAKADRIKASRPLQASVLEHNLLLMNELPGLAVEAILEPSDTVGAADLVLTVRHRTVSGDAQFDNRGGQFTGPEELLGTLRLASLLDRFDDTAITGVVTPIQPKKLQLISLDHTELLGTYGTTGSLFGSYVHTEPSGGGLGQFDVEGHAVSASATLAHPVILRRSERLDARFAFSFLNSQTDFDQIIEFNDGTKQKIPQELDDRIRALRLGATYSIADQYGGVNSVSGEVSQGLDILNATGKNKSNTSRDGGHANFTKFAANVSRLQLLSGGWSVLGTVKGQYSLDQLLASEQFAYGGAAYGRAFDPFELSADEGVAALLELRYDRLVGWPYLQSFQVFASGDYGYVHFKDTGSNRPEIDPSTDELNPFFFDINSSETAASLALGVRFIVTANISGSLEVAQPLLRTPNAENSKTPRPFFRITATF